MNKLQKEKSIRIKLLMRASKWPMTYKEAKRKLRHYDRQIRYMVELHYKKRKNEPGFVTKHPHIPEEETDA